MVLDFLDLPMRRYPHARLLARAFELRPNVTYDGLYLPLAEALECPLLAGDGALGNVPGCRAVTGVAVTSR